MTEPSEAVQARYERGARLMSTVVGEAGQRVVQALADVAPALAQHVVAYGFGEVYARPALAAQQRQLVTLGILTALGGCEPQLDVHVRAALNVGLSPAQIVETIIHASAYCGFPRALNAIVVVKRVLDECGLLPVEDQPPT
jgi:4-carboxymuconolactone decarboxylase